MRAFNVSTAPLILTLSALLAACAGGPPMGPGGPGGPGGPPVRNLFISPFGEAFLSEPGEAWPTAKWFAGADSDHDGALTFEEFAADGRRVFANLDTDRDGRLNQAELTAYEESLHRFGGMGGGRGDRGGSERNHGFPVITVPGPQGGGEVPLADTSTLGVAPQQAITGSSRMVRGRPPGRSAGYGVVADSGFFNLPQPVKSADVNVDQRVTAQEWAEATQRWFYSLDADRDGKLTLDTLPVTPTQAAAARGR